MEQLTAQQAAQIIDSLFTKQINGITMGEVMQYQRAFQFLFDQATKLEQLEKATLQPEIKKAS